MKGFGKSRKILLMDPDGLVRDSVTLFLEEMGCQVTTSVTAKEALRSLSEEEYQAVICAQYLSDMDGLDFMRCIRKMYPKMVKVLESDFAGSLDFFDEARMAGVTELIHKPFTAKDIQMLVSRLNQRHSLLETYNVKKML